MIDFVSQEAFRKTSEAFDREIARHDTKRYEDWLPLRAAITKEIGRYGRWNNQGEDCDFYHGDDWSHSLADGFALRTYAPLGKFRFVRLREILAAHSPHAVLSIGGDFDTPLWGMSIVVHPQIALACWDGKTAHQCRGQFVLFGYKDEEPNSPQTTRASGPRV
jgi:hypothetical protein